MPDRIQTYSIDLTGGLIENQSPIQQGIQRPGSLIEAINYEPAPNGGYRRIRGYEKFDPNILPGVGELSGVFAYYQSSTDQFYAIACRGLELYYSTGAGWTLLHTYTNPPIKFQYDTYNWFGEDRIIITDGANEPIVWNGSILTVVVDPVVFAALGVRAHNLHMFYGKDNDLVVSATNDEIDFTPAKGALVINVGKAITGLAPWRDNLYIFGINHIQRLAGTDVSNFALEGVSSRLGTIDPRTIQEFDSDLYYISQDGVRTVAGTERNEDLNLDSVSRMIPDTMEEYFAAGRLVGKQLSAIAAREAAQYRVFIGDPDYPSNERAMGLTAALRELPDGNTVIEWYKTRGFNASCSASATTPSEDIMLHGDFNGFIYKQDAGNDFDGTPVYSFLRLPFNPIELPERRKIFYGATIYIEPSDESTGTPTAIAPTMTYAYDFFKDGTNTPMSIPLGSAGAGGAKFGSAVYGTSVYSLNLLVNRVYLEGSGDFISFSFEAEDTNVAHSIRNIILEYGQKGRR